MATYQERFRTLVALTERIQEQLTPLAGTEKQVEWATRIRKDFVHNQVACHMGRLDPEGRPERFIEVVNGKPSASWWIQKRDTLPSAYEIEQFWRKIEHGVAHVW